ncbi:hypothetical protein BX600DRAFT_501295 [Xylariales sp. PMI_506]|nr:hypothetical protein BX600DRAFT_501295 [Xylariales sp. PMI_506]
MRISRQSKISRACDSCRQRKVKCDGADICANCRVSELNCQYTSVPKKRGPKVSKTLRTPPASQTSQEAGTTGVLDDHSAVSEDLLWLSPASHGEAYGPAAQTVTLSPQQGPIVHNQPLLQPDTHPTVAAKTARDALLQWMSAALPELPALEVVNKCISLYMQYTFPTAPMVHETTLRESASRYFPKSTRDTDVFRACNWEEEMAHMRAFALVTALCASVASVIPDSLLPYQQILARPCLDASRDVLKVFEDFDVEHPNATSIAIRILHATALQHITGKTALSYYALDQATFLIRHMRLHSEEVLSGYDAPEVQLLRNVFWQLYAADQASACLRSRPYFLHELLFDGGLTTQPSGGGREPIVHLLDASRPEYGDAFEDRLLVGFHFMPRLWSSAARLISDIKAQSIGGGHDCDTSTLTQAYMNFLGIIDDTPSWLQTSNVIISSSDGDAVQFQKTAFWVQRCTVLVTFQCLKLVILQQCINSKLWDIMGLNDEPLTLPMAKLAMVSDFVQTLDDIPFIFLKVKGEPTVERIRWVGSILLEVIDNAPNETIRGRAERYFQRLLDVLAKLNSKSSDVLAELKELSQTRSASNIPGRSSP